MNLTRLSWTRLISSRYRQELEALRSKLSKAGILSEIRDNLVSTRRGMTRFEIVVDERDLFKASKICHHAESGTEADHASRSPAGDKMGGSFSQSEGAEAEQVTKTEVVPPTATEPAREENAGGGLETGGSEPEGEFARATALLEKQGGHGCRGLEPVERRKEAGGGLRGHGGPGKGSAGT